jgi:hypothetical protein
MLGATRSRARGSPAPIGQLLDPSTLQRQGPNGGKPGEDSWGVFWISQIFKGSLTGPNNITPIDLAHPLWSVGQGGVEIAGAYFNRTDIGVQFNADGSVDFEFVGDTAELFVQPVGTYDNGAAGSSGRIAGQDKYATIGYDGAGAQLAGAVKFLTTKSEAGFFGTLAATEGIAHFIPSATTGSGDTDICYSITGGTDMALWDSDVFIPNPGPYNNADARLHVTNSPVTQTAVFDWLTSSSDPMTASFVPEPATLSLLALGGLAVLRRKG